jgi:hypothetical protein
MKILSILIWLVSSGLAIAQTVVIKSGDHPGFTRLVLELPKAADWQMGRTAEGYELRIADENLRFDLTGAFKDIQRNRLAAIWMDPKSGGLRLGIACACHALPFEFRAGIIVIDLRDGPPPKGSSFELALDGTDAVQLVARPSQRPQARPRKFAAATLPPDGPQPSYDWLVSDAPDIREKQPLHPALPAAVTLKTADIGPLKDALLQQLSWGAAQGIVQMTMPSLASRNAASPRPIGPRAAIHLGEVPGFDVATSREPAHVLIKDGAACIADKTLDVTGWGDDQPAPIQLANSRANLIGEFDRPNPKDVITAVKILIYLGFGAEARQMLAQMQVDDPDSGLWQSMAGLVDGGHDPEGPFMGMQTCDTAAALWATLALPKLTVGSPPRTDAVLRAFSALPAHLRRNLGPDLAAKFLAIDDVATARSISHSVQRGISETDTDADVAVMDAQIDIASGDPSAATAQLAPVLAQAGPNAAATIIALVDARVAAGDAIDLETSVALAALIREQAGSDLEPALRRAQILALGSAGDFDQAFALLPEMASAEHDLWQILARSGSGTAILNHAVMAPDASLPAISAADRSQIAVQLSALGLPDAALVWIGAQTGNSSDADRLLAAKTYLSRGEPDAGLAWIEGLNDSAALELRAEALWRLGKPAEAAEAWANAGNTDAELRARSWAQNWDALSKSEASSWQAAAGLLTAAPGQDIVNAPGPLALGTALVADSSSARAILTALLASVPSPVPAQ